MKVYLGTKRIQKLGRVAIDDAALKNARMRVGDDIEIYFDTDTSAIVIEKAKSIERRPLKNNKQRKANERTHG